MLVSDQVFSFPPSSRTQESAGASQGQHRLLHAIYIFVIATAMLGWTWLIVWFAVELMAA